MGFAPSIDAKSGWEPMDIAPTATTSTPSSLANFWPQVCPCSSVVDVKHEASSSGWPSTPPSSSLTYFTASFAPSVAYGLGSAGPPCWLVHPMTILLLLASAAPFVPPVYCT